MKTRKKSTRFFAHIYAYDHRTYILNIFQLKKGRFSVLYKSTELA